MSKMYSLEACENLISNYIDKSGSAIVLEEGSLGLGTILLHGERLKTALIKEVFINAWSSGHTVRMYNKVPKKYQEIIDNN